MSVVILIIGAIIIASAVRNTHTQLFGALAQDVPAFVIWGAAIFTVGAIGFVPGLKPVSRGLLALVLLVLVINNYERIIAGFSTPLGSNGQGSSGGGGGGGGGGGISFQLPGLPDFTGGLPRGTVPWPVMT